EQRLELVVACEVGARCEDADRDPAVAQGEEVRAFLVLVGEGAVRWETVRKEVEVSGSALSRLERVVCIEAPSRAREDDLRLAADSGEVDVEHGRGRGLRAGEKESDPRRSLGQRERDGKTAVVELEAALLGLLREGNGRKAQE